MVAVRIDQELVVVWKYGYNLYKFNLVCNDACTGSVVLLPAFMACPHF